MFVIGMTHLRISLRRRGTLPGLLRLESSCLSVVRPPLLSYTAQGWLTVDALAVSAAFGLFLILCLLFSIQDMAGTIAAAQPVLQIFSDVFGETGATVLFSLVSPLHSPPSPRVVTDEEWDVADHRLCLALWSLLPHRQLSHDVRVRA